MNIFKIWKKSQKKKQTKYEKKIEYESDNGSGYNSYGFLDYIYDNKIRKKMLIYIQKSMVKFYLINRLVQVKTFLIKKQRKIFSGEWFKCKKTHECSIPKRNIE